MEDLVKRPGARVCRPKREGPLRILMLVTHEDISGPIPKISPLLAQGIREAGSVLEVGHWSRHSDSESLLAKLFGRVKDLLQIRARFSHAPFDVLFVQTSHTWLTLARDIPLVLTCRMHGRPIALMFHGSRYEPLLTSPLSLFSLATRLLISLVDGVFLLSSEEQRQWRRIMPRGRFYIVSNPFVRSAEAPLSRPDDGLDGSHDELLYVGRLMEEKGVFDLVSAIAYLESDRDVHLRLVGGGPHADRLRRYVLERGLGDRVQLCGYVSGDALWALYASADLFVLPTYWKEGFPTVLAEAMSMGLPIVTTPVRGAVDHLQDGVNAVFVPPRDPLELAAVIACLLDDPSLRHSMSKNNRERVADFDPTTVARAYVDGLTDVVEACRRRSPS